MMLHNERVTGRYMGTLNPVLKRPLVLQPIRRTLRPDFNTGRGVFAHLIITLLAPDHNLRHHALSNSRTFSKGIDVFWDTCSGVMLWRCSRLTNVSSDSPISIKCLSGSKNRTVLCPHGSSCSECKKSAPLAWRRDTRPRSASAPATG